MHNTINFWYGNWEKVCLKRSWQREDAKKGGPALMHTDKFPSIKLVSSLVCKLGHSRKKVVVYMVVEHILFWNKKLEFLGLLFHPWKFWTKQNPAKLYDTYWKWSQILCEFFFISPEKFSYVLFSPRKFHIVFLQCSWKIQVLE